MCVCERWCVGVWYHLVGGEGSFPNAATFAHYFHTKYSDFIVQCSWVIGPARARSLYSQWIHRHCHGWLARLTLNVCRSCRSPKPAQAAGRSSALPSSTLPLVWFLFCFRLPQPVSRLTHQVAACVQVLHLTAVEHLWAVANSTWPRRRPLDRLTAFSFPLRHARNVLIEKFVLFIGFHIIETWTTRKTFVQVRVKMTQWKTAGSPDLNYQ